NGPCGESGISQKYKLTYINDLEIGSYSTEQVCEEIKKIQGIDPAALVYFDSFVKKYKCVDNSNEFCSCESFDYTDLPNNYAIKLEQNKENMNVEISLLEKITFVVFLGFRETGISTIIENKILCSYIPTLAVENKMSTSSDKFFEYVSRLDEFIVESNINTGRRSMFSRDNQIYIMQYGRYTCFPVVSPSFDNYNEFNKLKSC
ncbi:hypothetical protein CL621_02150, partial [archaeon]|nr:hypothetical protein [archaeon]